MNNENCRSNEEKKKKVSVFFDDREFDCNSNKRALVRRERKKIKIKSTQIKNHKR